MKCTIFRCSKKPEMYLYVPHNDNEEEIFKNLPQALLQITGRLEKAMDLDLSPDRKLARADVVKVIAALEEKGFYLQSPPNEVLRQDDSMLNNPSDGF